MKKLLLSGLAVLFLAIGAARAAEWNCPSLQDGASVELRKEMVHLWELKVTGNIQVAPLRVEVKEKKGKVTLNGKLCQEVKEK